MSERPVKILNAILLHLEELGVAKEECSLTKNDIFNLVKKTYPSTGEYAVTDLNFSEAFNICIANEYIKKTKDNETNFCMTKDGFNKLKNYPRNQLEGGLY